MSPRKGELHSMIAELATLEPEDAEAILAALDLRARERVRSLLGVSQPQPDATVPAGHTAGLFSDWISERLAQRSSMTETAHAALRRCANDVAALERPSHAHAAGAATGPSLLSRLGSAIGRSMRRL